MYLVLNENELTGSLPYEVGQLVNLGAPDVSKNKLSGEIPGTLGNCKVLEILNLEENFFQGSIPSSFSSLRSISELNLSHNNLSGQIPKYLSDFKLEYVDLSYNDLEGEVPVQGVFKNASATSIMGNKQLCGGIPEFNLTRCSATNTTKSKSSSKLKLIAAITSGILGAIILTSVLLFCYLQKKIGKNRPISQPSFIAPFLQVTYEDLLKATNRFSSDNLIGTGSFGSVYRGVLEPDGGVVAVKVLNLLHPGASKSFMAECEALKNIRHRNLVKILTVCSSIDFQGTDFKALVYEFMVNGNLEMWLHPADQLTRLNLYQRLSIAIDVANALDYLNNHSQRCIIHCDLKPSNILWDGDMIAHVGDFGLARFLSEDSDQLVSDKSNQSSSIGIKGTLGYAPPEYGMGSEVTTYGDVYSYGIMLLEMFTGKRPTDAMFKDGLNLHNFVLTALRLDLHDGQLVGSLSPHVGNLSFLRVINLSNNSLGHSIPPEIGRLFRLRVLDFSSNMFSGEIPVNISGCVNLLKLNVSYNNLDGELPAELGSLSKLQLLFFSRNNLVGQIPSSFGNLSSLEMIYGKRNNLVGNIPETVKNLKKLQEFAFGANNLTGTVPPSIYNISSLTLLSLPVNQLHGTLPPDLGLTPPNLEILRFHTNQLSGPVPPSISNASNLVELSISRNKFNGKVPSLSRLPKLQRLEIDKNMLGYGEDNDLNFLYTLANKTNLQYVIISDNNLGGELPELLSNFSTELRKIGFGRNQIRGTIPTEIGNLVNLVALGLETNQLTALKNIRHRNLVKLLTVCSSIDLQGRDFKALVYELMVNGSLEMWLHPTDQLKSWNLYQRLSIAIDVANALDYLHNHSQMRIIHCDLKPNNILLDGDMTARVGDFGLARFLSEDSEQLLSNKSNQSSSIGIKGTIGYAPPEYGMGSEVTTYGDVYSYGIMLLEMFTGKRPTDAMFKDGLNLHSFVQMALSVRVVEVIDPILVQDGDQSESGNSGTLECVTSIFEVGLACSAEFPRERINISSAAAELQRIRDILQKSA
ncbi:hypothetical protein K2173_004145 [Erythroxylum novogranatense]|uniref:non-specific serine/threonine protein kinase n=1 Tax=Erythroxylum novogranatense TaxID=1862640 RepID=A0AAV8SYL6_9ROSI|nr:hypothetical protein K2173_004145 [Erythroxylum novogranatense]